MSWDPTNSKTELENYLTGKTNEIGLNQVLADLSLDITDANKIEALGVIKEYLAANVNVYLKKDASGDYTVGFKLDEVTESELEKVKDQDEAGLNTILNNLMLDDSLDENKENLKKAAVEYIKANDNTYLKKDGDIYSVGFKLDEVTNAALNAKATTKPEVGLNTILQDLKLDGNLKENEKHLLKAAIGYIKNTKATYLKKEDDSYTVGFKIGVIVLQLLKDTLNEEIEKPEDIIKVMEVLKLDDQDFNKRRLKEAFSCYYILDNDKIEYEKPTKKAINLESALKLEKLKDKRKKLEKEQEDHKLYLDIVGAEEYELAKIEIQARKNVAWHKAMKEDSDKTKGDIDKILGMFEGEECETSTEGVKNEVKKATDDWAKEFEDFCKEMGF